MASHYDVIVLGVGSMGAAACWYLTRRKHRVLGLEQFDIPHDYGSHGGQSRIIRKAYYEHKNYVALLERAYHNWHELQNETSATVFYKTGLLYFGDPSSALISGTRETAKECNIPLDVMTSSDAAVRYPLVKFDVHHQVLFEPDAGFITPEKAIAVYVSDAVANGASIRGREQVIDWEFTSDHIIVKTNTGTYTTDKLVITAGAWTKKVIPSLPANLKVSRQLIAWMSPKNWGPFTFGKFPCWFMSDEDENMFYGFPILPASEFSGPAGLKLAHHKPGEEVDPDNVDRSVRPGDELVLKRVLDKYFPGAAQNVLAIKTCLYTNSADADFIIDHVPGTDKRVAVATGFSGHGFKFASVIGEILADLAINGSTDLPIDFLKLERFQQSGKNEIS